MRTLVAMVLSIGPAYAGCNETMLSVRSWEVARVGDLLALPGISEDWRVKLTVEVQFNGDRPVRMIDGIVSFSDALGAPISSLVVDRDVRLSPGDLRPHTGTYRTQEFGRLLLLDRADVIVSTCVRGVIYADGTKEEF